MEIIFQVKYCYSFYFNPKFLLGTLSFDMSGSLAKKTKVRVEEMKCGPEIRDLSVIVPTEIYNFEDAIHVCHKFRQGSMGRDFNDFSDYLVFHKKAQENQAVRYHSWNGARIILFMGHLSKSGGRNQSDFVHYISNRTIPTKAWFDGPPSGKILHSIFKILH